MHEFLGNTHWLGRRLRVARRRLLRAPAIRQKRDFARRLESGALERIEPLRALEAPLFSMCGQKSFLDMMVSLRSFLRHVGAPPKCSILSDGTLVETHKQQLEAIHPCVRIVEIDAFRNALAPATVALIEERLAGYPFVPKLLLLLAASLRDEPWGFMDSDVVFFPAFDLAPLSDFAGELWYLPYEMPGLDARLLAQTQPVDERLVADATTLGAPVNSGLCLFGRRPAWEAALEPLRSFSGPPIHTCEQTFVHNMMHFNGARALPAERFLLLVNDALGRADHALNGVAVARHYYSSVRHKMWLLPAPFYA